MSSSFNRIKKNIIEAMQSTNNQGTSAYDSVAEVRRVEGDTAWVHIAGGVDETPVKLTIAAKAGDVVQVRVGGGRAWITGNASAPPTDDKTAIAAKSLADIAGNRANTAQKTADQAQIVANSALQGTKENAAQMAQMVINFNGDIENLQDQIDGNITTWFYDADPAMNLPPVTDWDTDEKKNAHLGDIYYNTIKGYAWRFMKSGNTYSWERITDTDVTKALADAAKAQDTADSKRRVFYSTPTVPYDAGDLWVQGSGGDILRCAQAKTSTGLYDRNDWVLASKYTDNSALNTWIEGDFATTIKELEDGLVDAKVETYYQTTDPSTGWSDTQKSEHKGDLWYNSTASVQKYYRWSGTAWQELTATPPQAVFDNIDRKATIYIGTTTPTNPESRDLWFKGANEPILTYVNNSWVEYNKYTDDTAANTAQADIDRQKEYFWHDANGAHVLGSKTAATRYRTDIDSEGMHIKDVSGEVQEVAKFTADGAQIGKTGEAHQELDYHSWRLTDKDGNVFAEVKDLRGKDGTATIIAKFKGDGETTEFSLPVTATEIVDITVDGTSTEATLTELNTEIKFVSAPAQKAKIICTYKTDDERAKSYTFGKRVANKSTGAYSFAEGINAVASGKCSHSEGLGGYAEGNCSHAEGWATTASGDCAHAEGIGTHAKGYCSHAEGKETEAQGDWSHSAGYRTIAGFDNQMVIGSYNDNKEDSLFEIGNGTYRSHSNAFRVTKDGKAYDGERCLSDIGTVYRAEKDVAITTADINTRVKGATITVPAGIYVICGEWIFDTSSTTGARNINLDIYVGENMEARSRVYSNAKNYASLHASTIVVLDATTQLSVRGSSSEKSPAERTRIRAVRVK